MVVLTKKKGKIVLKILGEYFILRGFYGAHHCGVTLLSAPPNPTVLVSATHCNYICKDDGGNIVQTCCCRNSTEPGNWRQVRSRKYKI